MRLNRARFRQPLHQRERKQAHQPRSGRQRAPMCLAPLRTESDSGARSSNASLSACNPDMNPDTRIRLPELDSITYQSIDSLNRTETISLHAIRRPALNRALLTSASSSRTRLCQKVAAAIGPATSNENAPKAMKKTLL